MSIFTTTTRTASVPTSTNKNVSETKYIAAGTPIGILASITYPTEIAISTGVWTHDQRNTLRTVGGDESSAARFGSARFGSATYGVGEATLIGVAWGTSIKN